MRLELLQLLESRLEGGSVGEAEAEQLLRQALLPCLVWHAGKIAAASRFAAISAVATVFRTKLLPGGTAAQLLHQVNKHTCCFTQMPVRTNASPFFSASSCGICKLEGGLC